MGEITAKFNLDIGGDMTTPASTSLRHRTELKDCPDPMGFTEDAIDEGMRAQNKELGLCEEILPQIRDELYRATRQHGPMKSGHEGYAVILEEMDELWHEIKHGTKSKARKEAVQVAAMAIRLIANCYSKIS